MNIGIFAHVDAGKTTLTENLLFETGAIRTLGRVDNGNTVTDTMALEKKRGITIQSTPISFQYKDLKINLIDTPGHVEFVAEVERAMSILDGAILVISAKEGVQSHTMLLFEALKKLGIPVILFINKIDRLGVDLLALRLDIKKELSDNIIDLHEVNITATRTHLGEIFKAESLLETLSLYDDEILIKYLDEQIIPEDDIINTIKTLTHSHKLYPVCYGSALNNIGISSLLEAIESLLPQLKLNPNGETSGVVFKIMRNKDNKREIYIRLYAGMIKSRGVVNDEKVSFVKLMVNGKLEYSTEAYANDIAIIMGPENLKVGDLIGQPTHYQTLSMGTPTLRTRISAHDPRELAEIIDGLAESDPFLEYDIEPHSGDLTLNLFGEIQMEILKALIFEEHQIEVTFSEPVIIYKEMPIDQGEYALHIFTKEHPFNATVGLRVEPCLEGVQLDSEVSTGFLPQTFQNGIVDGIYSTLREGLKGWEICNIKITLIEGGFNSVCSTPSDFRNLTPIVLMEALSLAQTKLLWPVNKFVIKIDQHLYGKVMSDLLSMKANTINFTEENSKFTIKGILPVETSLSYEKRFISLTSGLGSYQHSFHKYVEAPDEVVKERPRNHVDPLNRGQYLLSKLRTT